MSLAALTQRSAPLQLNLMAYRIQLRLTVMQAEVLVEALKHLPQVLRVLPARVRDWRRPGLIAFL